MSNIKPISFNGKTQSRTAWAKELGLTYCALAGRLNRMPIAEALTTPKRQLKLYEHNSKRQSAADWAKELGIGVIAFYHRVNKYPPDKVFRPGKINPNETNTKLIEHGGRKLTHKQWAEELGISYSSFRHRIRSQSPYAFQAGKHRCGKRYEYHGKQLTVPEIAALEGKIPECIYHRIQKYGNAMTRQRIRTGKQQMPPPITPYDVAPPGTSKTFPASK